METNKSTDVRAMNELEALKSNFDEQQENLKNHETKLKQFWTWFHCLGIEDAKILWDFEEELTIFEAEVQEFKKVAFNLSRSLEDTIVKMEFSEFGPESFADSEEGCEEKLRKYVVLRKEKAEGSRQKGKKSLMELMLNLDQFDPRGRIAFDSIRALAVNLGIGLSLLLVEYFFLFRQSQQEEMASKIRFVESTIRSKSLDENSIVIIDRFISVLEFLDRGMRCHTKDKSTNENVLFGEVENDLLGMILFEVLHLETAFIAPLFPMHRFTSKNVLQAVGRNIRKSFSSKLNKISSKINELKKEFSEGNDHKMNEFKEMLDVGIKEIWNKLDLKGKKCSMEVELAEGEDPMMIELKEILDAGIEEMWGKLDLEGNN